eukprot:g39131.t1
MVPWEQASSRMDVDGFIAAKVVILTAAPSAIDEWTGEPWVTTVAVRGRGRDIIDLLGLPNRRRVRQTSRIRLPPFEGEIATYKTALRLRTIANLANKCTDLSQSERDWLIATCSAQRTEYRGVGEFLRDYSRKGSDDVEAKRWKAVCERVSEGKALGPFDRPPFPNASCPHQAIVAYEFTIPKSK